MDEALSRQLDELRSFTFQQLHHKHIEIFGEPPRSRHKRQVLRRIGWRLQVVAHGGLSERARLHALAIANDADLRVLPPRDCLDGPSSSVNLLSARDPRLPRPGAKLVRVFKGKEISVNVLEDGFEYEGDVFKSLSAVAQRATGVTWNGFTFFRLRYPSVLKNR